MLGVLRPRRRAIYRRLVDAFHPDKVQDPQEKAACTEVMKDITSAYRHGDLARLLEIERRWLSQQSGMEPGAAGLAEPASDEEATQRAVMVERGNDELRAQLAQLERELRAARRAPEARLARDLIAIACEPTPGDPALPVWELGPHKMVRHQGPGVALAKRQLVRRSPVKK